MPTKKQSRINDPETGTKWCRCTKYSHPEPVELPATKFRPDNRNIDGLDLICEDCARMSRNEAKRKARLKDPEKEKLKRKERHQRARANFRDRMLAKATREITVAAHAAEITTAADTLNAITRTFGGSKAFGLMFAEEYMQLPPSVSKLRLGLDLMKMQAGIDEATRDQTPDNQVPEDELIARIAAALQMTVQELIARRERGDAIDVPLIEDHGRSETHHPDSSP